MSADFYDAPRPPRRWRRMAILLVLGMGVGAPAGYLIGRLIKHAERVSALGWSDSLSLGIAALLLFSGLSVLAATLANFSAAYLADPHGDEPARRVRPAQMTYFRLQGAVLALAGGMMATPVMLRILVPDLPLELANTAFLGIVAAFLLQTALNIAVWFRSDELVRRATSDAGAVCFWLLQGLLFIWAAGEKLALLPHLNSWDGLTVLMSLYLIMSVAVAYRRGLG